MVAAKRTVGADASAAVGSEAPKKETRRVVRYVGPADARMITKPEWAAIGIDAEKGTVWTADNHFTVAAGELNPDQLSYLETDADFRIREVSGDSTEEEEAERAALARKRFTAGAQQVAGFIDHEKGAFGSPQRVVYEGPAAPVSLEDRLTLLEDRVNEGR